MGKEGRKEGIMVAVRFCPISLTAISGQIPANAPVTAAVSKGAAYPRQHAVSGGVISV